MAKEKEFEIVKASKRMHTENIKGIYAGGNRWHEFDESGKFKTDDPGVAREIEEQYGMHSKYGGTGDVVVCEIDKESNREAGHTYMFRMPQMPWKDK